MSETAQTAAVVVLLTLDDVRRALQLRSVRQVRRLDGLPVLRLSRRESRVHPADFAAWVERHRLTGIVSGAYTSPRDGRGATTDATSGGPQSTKARRCAGRSLEHVGEVGAGRATHPRRGRPLDSDRLQRRAS